jgi:glycosyltransferase involved in cell wall biosynthesis
MKKLLVIVSDQLSVLIRKGEITPRYYNPGELFNEVHILMTNDDKVDIEPLQKTVGNAKLILHNLPNGKRLFFTSLGWQPSLFGRWIKKGLKIAEEISPKLIRVHDNFIQGYLAYEIKRKLGTPYVISLHGVWDRDELITIRDRIVSSFRRKLERVSLENCDHVIAVYRPILRYAKEYGAKKLSLVYNVVAKEHLKEKEGYEIRGTPKIITVNRQVREKNPENIIKAISNMDCQYTIVGDGPYHPYLRKLAKRLGAESKVKFMKAIPNKELCDVLPQYDFMVSHCDYWGISKTIIEASIVGLPVIINQHPVEPLPEYEGDWLMVCPNTPEGYAKAIERMLSDSGCRKKLGLAAKTYAKENWWPEEMENKIVSIYRDLLN